MSWHKASQLKAESFDADPPPLHVTANELRSVIPAQAYEKSDVRAIGIFLAASLAYCFFFLGSFLTPVFFGRVASSIAAGLFAGILFIIGHDACHLILASRKLLNRLIGRICFLPTSVPYSSWEFAHNRLHHGWTNVKDIDYSWCPLSLKEYQKMSLPRQFMERFYRSPIGFGWNYFFEIWWKHLAYPRSNDLVQIDSRSLLIDRIIILLFVSLQVLTVWILDNSANFTSSLLHALILPHIVWNWLMGFVIYLQHTHPKTQWFANSAQRSYLESQIQNTVHVIFPRPIGLLLHNMMEHTVHHLDQRIPLYHLCMAQDAICQTFGQYVTHFQFTFRAFGTIVRSCQLYDYDNHQWLTFDGLPSVVQRERIVTSEDAALGGLG
jgi:acyl-lipid omega-6 desaturase (Delta-12 desaturase)